MNKKENRLIRFFKMKSITSKLLLAITINCVIVAVLMILLYTKSTTDLVQNMLGDKLKTDISYLEDIIDKDQDSSWNIRDGMLYKGDVPIGDGTEENANLDPFYETEEKSGTFVYTFMKCSDDGLEWVGDEKTGYQQGHYIRVAGTTKDPDGNSIIGTYMDKKVADILDAEGEYEGEANVTGGKIYCYYQTLVDDNGEIVGAIVVGRSMSTIIEISSAASSQIFVILIIAVLLGAIVIFATAKLWTRSVDKIVKYIRRLGNGELPDEKLVLNAKDEISEVADSVNEMVDSLREGKRMGSELRIATDIQANLLPKIFPAFPYRDDFDIHATMHPAKEVGGDFYDFFMTDTDHIAIVIADVSGKGVPAALFMVTAKTLIKDHGLMGMSPGEIFTRANKLLCEGNDAGLFVTAWIAIVQLSTGHVEYANAGHNPPLLCHNGEFHYIKSKPGLVLAGLDGMHYKSGEFMIGDGDILYLYTDGVTESTNINEELYGEQRLLNLLNEHANDSMREICEAVNKDTTEFTGEAPQFDDVTMVAFKYFADSHKGKEMEVEAKIENISVLTEFADEVLEKLGCSMKAQMQIDVAIDEILSNICYYAYRTYTGYMKLDIRLAKDGRAEIIFIDGGVPYNPLESKAPDLTLAADERQIGGLGIHIVRKTMDEVHYDYKENRNILRLVKTIK